MGRDPDTNALDPRVLKRNIMVNGVNFIKKPQKKLMGFFRVRQSSQVEQVYVDAAQLIQYRCSYKDKLLKDKAREHCGLLANVAFLPTPMSADVHNLHESVSAAAAVAPGSSAAT